MVWIDTRPEPPFAVVAPPFPLSSPPHDGTDQLTFEGLPLYSFTEEEAGQLDGDGFVDDFEGTRFDWAAATTGPGSAPSGSNPSNSPSPY